MGRRAWTLILPYYENPTMLKMQLEYIEAWPREERESVELIVVDDGSPYQPALPVVRDWCGGRELLPFKFRLYRIGVDVRWNWIACRNLAMAEAGTSWRLMTDIDHLVSSEVAHRISSVKLKDSHIYRFSRVDWPRFTEYKPHPNSWLMTGDMFDKVGGYDERFSGFYGTDGMFRDRCAAAARRVDMLQEALIRVDRKEVPDASTVTYGRKELQDKEGVQRIRAEIINSGDLKPHRLTFPWERLV